MPSSLSTAKFLSALLIDSLCISHLRHTLFSRRGYAVASQGAARLGNAAKEEAENAWVPDPVTGYYRPANRANEIDVAELRDLLLKQRVRSSN
ncbi:hypothetical protein V2J09_016079 [Rumex salicifolius]